MRSGHPTPPSISHTYCLQSGKRPGRGFGLVEQMITLLILAILVMIAVPGFRRLIDHHELRAAQSDFIAALLHARNVAVNEQRKIIFCASRDGHACSEDNLWTEGWLIGRGTANNALDGTPLYVGGHAIKRLTITGNKNTAIYFTSDGTSGNSYQTLYFCSRHAELAPLAVVISSQGRIRGKQTDAAEAKCGAAMD